MSDVKMRRTHLDICVDILKAAEKGSNKTKIVYTANLNFEIVKQYLCNLIDSEMLMINERGKYVTTGKGTKFVENYFKLLEPFRILTIL